MDTTKQVYTGKALHAKLLEDKFNTCIICHEVLEFSHFIDYGEHKVKECPICRTCGLKFNIVEYTLN